MRQNGAQEENKAAAIKFGSRVLVGLCTRSGYQFPMLQNKRRKNKAKGEGRVKSHSEPKKRLYR